MNPVVSEVAIKGVGIATPFGKISLYITLFFLGFLIVSSSLQSVKENSWFPLFDDALLRIAGADHSISKEVDNLGGQVLDFSGGIFSKNFWVSFWLGLNFWFNILVNIWFIVIIIIALKWFFDYVNNTNPILNLVFALVLFLIFQLIVGLVLFPINHSGETLPDDKVEVLNMALSESYPFEGLVKLGKHLFDGNLFGRTQEFIDSPVGEVVSDLPGEYDFDLNESGGMNV